jgi:hypothetical protein
MFMGSEIKVRLPKAEISGSDARETPLLDLSDAAVKQLVRTAQKRGYIADDQINALLSSEEINSEQAENILAKLSEMGINVVETKEPRLDEEPAGTEEPDEKEGTASDMPLRPNLKPRRWPSALMILCACTCAKWPRWSSSRAKERLLSPSVSRPAVRQ